MQSNICEKIRNRIQGYGTPENIIQLCLDSIPILEFSPDISEEIQKAHKLQFISMNNCRLKSLLHIPAMTNLYGFEAQNNKLTGKDLKQIAIKCPNITTLALDNNQICDIKVFSELSEMAQLEYLEIRGNPICQVTDYVEKIFQILPNVKLIDGTDIFGDNNAVNAEETDSEGDDGSDQNQGSSRYLQSEGQEQGEVDQELEDDLEDQYTTKNPRKQKKYRQL